jgi:AcrR family transcriptional regulator
MSAEPGLRQRKKQRTRETIARAARELFAERGYHATTLPDIAEAADVSTRTIFAYFPSKEDILFAEFPLMKDALERALDERPEGEEALETVRAFMLASVGMQKSDVDERIGNCIHNDATLRTHLRARIAQLEEVIAPAIAKDIGASEDDIRPKLVAASLTAAINVMSEQGGPKNVAALVDPVIEFLRSGLDAIKEPRAR